MQPVWDDIRFIVWWYDPYENVLKGEIDVELLNYESHQTLTAKLNT